MCVAVCEKNSACEGSRFGAGLAMSPRVGLLAMKDWRDGVGMGMGYRVTGLTGGQVTWSGERWLVEDVGRGFGDRYGCRGLR